MTDSLIQALELVRLGNDCFRGPITILNPGNNVYGGQVLAQSVDASSSTVESHKAIHSLHAYFIGAGEPFTPIDYKVERVGDGRSFSVRQVEASQNGRTILKCTASFHIAEEGLRQQTQQAGEKKLPEDYQSITDFWAGIKRNKPDSIIHPWDLQLPWEMRSCNWGRTFSSALNPAPRNMFLRLRERLPDQSLLHHAMLAYVSDYWLLPAVIDAQPIHGRQQGNNIASLNHAMWFHAPIDINEWMLFRSEAQWAGSGRGLAKGELFNMKGELVATTLQEGLLRVPPEVVKEAQGCGSTGIGRTE